ncbi:hypothetical protein ACH24_05665 [Francisella persica ATCC VR-331]|uniref:Uncharacterized protein n=1 Tax=Francisella persica ATCC VR-331 TaxID=1086726 RepID=A0AAC8VEY6_9GAMM|nr:hypothetical protein [Francisella persica]ALB02092.1 hypothetical protein ACH24_05665 [Francisella persica ATCC VR-331]ANH77347.1 hypothetical protein FSC845_01770 [Francisella persica ATCC VR-331]
MEVITQNKGGYSNDLETKLYNYAPIYQIIFRQKILELVDNAKNLSVPAGLLPEFSDELILSKNFRSMLMILMQAVQKKVNYQNLGMLYISKMRIVIMQ